MNASPSRTILQYTGAMTAAAVGGALFSSLGIVRIHPLLSLLVCGPLFLFALSLLLLQSVRYRRLRQSLELEQALTRTLLDQLPLAVYYKDSDGRFQGGNRALEQLFGRTLKEIRGKRLNDFNVNPEQPESLARHDKAFIQSQSRDEKREVRILVMHDQQVEQRDLINYRARFQNPADASEGFVGVLLDVTEVRKTEKLQEELESRLRKLPEHLPGVMFQYQEWPDGNCRFPYASEGMQQIFGVTPEQAAKDANLVWERVHPDDVDALRASAHRSGETLKVWSTLCRVIGVKGDTIWISGQSTPESQADGSTIWHGYFSDITEAKLAETAAHQNAELLRTMFENLPDHVYYKDREHRYLGGSRTWWETRAQSLDAILGKTDADFYPKDLAREIRESEKRIMKTGLPERHREQHRLENGSFYYLESLKCPFFGPGGEVAGIVGISRDVTEQVEAEQHLIRAKEAAEEASRTKSEFLATMSHEIRTPMNGVIGATSILLTTGLTEEQQEFLRTIQVSGENLLVIINDILDYSKIEAGRIELESSELDLLGCLDDAVSLFSSTAVEKKIELACEIDPQVPEFVIGDVTRLRQILVNLLGNAVKFTEEGEVLLTVKALKGPDNAGTCVVDFQVRDTGVGIPVERQHRLFQAFSQADASNTRRFGGTGLGLVISSRLVELMGGTIDFESSTKSGSSFHFTVPFRLPPQAFPTQQAPLLEGRHLVVVDDNDTQRGILAALLESWGASVSAFSDGQCLLAELSRLDPVDVAMLDYQMPGLNGLDLAEKLHQSPGWQDIPIVLLSSVDTPYSDAVQLRMAKPAKLRSLRKHLTRLLNPDKAGDPDEDTPTAEKPGDDPPLRILVAEDNAVNQRLNEMMLKRLGYVSVTVEDGQEAVDVCAREHFDAVLMDVQMPRMDGLEATRRIRAHHCHEDRPYIVALTAGALDSDREAAMDSGMNAFLAKPLKLEQLKQALAKIPERATQ